MADRRSFLTKVGAVGAGAALGGAASAQRRAGPNIRRPTIRSTETTPTRDSKRATGPLTLTSDLKIARVTIPDGEAPPAAETMPGLEPTGRVPKPSSRDRLLNALSGTTAGAAFLRDSGVRKGRPTQGRAIFGPSRALGGLLGDDPGGSLLHTAPAIELSEEVKVAAAYAKGITLKPNCVERADGTRTPYFTGVSYKTLNGVVDPATFHQDPAYLSILAVSDVPVIKYFFRLALMSLGSPDQSLVYLLELCLGSGFDSAGAPRFETRVLVPSFSHTMGVATVNWAALEPIRGMSLLELQGGTRYHIELRNQEVWSYRFHWLNVMVI
ncbi:MAG TPA: hypothetical protein QGH10_18470 [Armatimonadota bacterium]|nr:hypothetical protein [Armatimonadota bacterium]